MQLVEEVKVMEVIVEILVVIIMEVPMVVIVEVSEGEAKVVAVKPHNPSSQTISV